MYIYNKKIIDKSNARLQGFDDYYAIFSLKGLNLKGEYNFINYHPLWSLVSLEKLEEEESTTKTWTNIKNYHEHRLNHIGLRGQVKWRVSPHFVH